MAPARSSVLFLFCLLLGCNSREEPEAFRLDRFLQAGKEDVFLNEKLVFKCNAWADPFSITRDSLTIQTEEGIPAAGRFWVNGNEIEFLPDPILDPELKGGGFRPGTVYEVFAAGFPRIQGLRALDGRILPQSRRFRFRVIDPAKLPAGVRSPFLDEMPGKIFAVQGFSAEPRLAEPLRIDFTKPLRPDCLGRRPIRLFEGNLPGRGEEIPLDCRLSSNLESARVELKPDWSRIRTDAVYRIEMDAARLLDFGGNPLFTEGFANQRPILSFRFLP